jgi:hypothetical protein
MTPEQQQIFNERFENVSETISKNSSIIGWMRYEVLRQLNPTQIAELYSLYLAGARFDNLVDELVVKNVE